MVKSPEEQAFIREAARRTVLAIEATHRRLAAGNRPRATLSAVLEQEFQALGVRGGGLVQFGPSAACPHGGPGDRRLAAGDVVLIDAGCKVHGYTSDVTRTVCFGSPSDEIRKVYAAVDRAQQAGIDALKAGRHGRRGRPRGAPGDRGRRLRRRTSRIASATASAWTATSRRIWCAATRRRWRQATR